MSRPALLAATLLALFVHLPHARVFVQQAGPRSYAMPSTRGEREGPSSYPSEWEWLRRTSPSGRADEAAFPIAVASARALQSASGGFRLDAGPLELVGPDNIGGRFSDIAWHPTDVNVLYAGAANGGVWKTTNGGTSWGPITDGQLQNSNIGDIAIDPTNPQRVFVGTGEANGGHNNFPGGGVYRSTDAGTTWTFVGLGQSASIGRILVDPLDGNRVFVAAQGSYFGPSSERGVYRSTNGGTVWSRVLFVSDSTAATDIVIDPLNPNRMLAAMWERVRRPNSSHLFGPTSGIWRSLNGGTTWAPLGPVNGLPDATLQNIGRIGLALCPTNPSIAYALINDGTSPIGLWRSTDFGTTWENRDTDLEIQGAGFSWYFGQVRVAPDDCNRVYAMDVQFMRSDDGGLSFPLGGIPIHVDHHALAFRPGTPNTLMLGNDGGLYKSTDAGGIWTKVQHLPVNQFYEIGLDFSDPSRFYGGTQDNGTLRTFSGVPDSWQNIFGGDGFYVSVDPRNSNVIYAESQFGNAARTTDGGLNWTGIVPPVAANERFNWSTPVKLDPTNPDVVYYGTQRLWRSTDRGGSWGAVSNDLTSWVPGARLGTITTIAASPVDPAIVWVGTDDGNVWRGVRDTGGVFTWTNVRTAVLPLRWVTRVVPHPTNAQAAWVTFNGLKWQEQFARIFSTTDGGASWTDISSNLPEVPINALTVDPANGQRLYVGTDLGAYATTDAGRHWSYLHPDLPLVSVYDLAIHPTARYLAIGTHARSMYKLDLGPVVGVPDRPTAITAQLSPGYPNPFSQRTALSISLTQESRVRLVVYDAAGRRVRTLADGVVAAGRREVVWDGRDDAGRALRSGRYRAQLELPGGAVQSQGVVLVR